MRTTIKATIGVAAIIILRECFLSPDSHKKRALTTENSIFSIIGGFWSVQVLLARYPEVELRDSKVRPKILRRH